jgi:hypothetical protein
MGVGQEAGARATERRVRGGRKESSGGAPMQQLHHGHHFGCVVYPGLVGHCRIG